MEAAPEVLCIIFSFSTTCTVFVYLNNILYIMPSKKKYKKKLKSKYSGEAEI